MNLIQIKQIDGLQTALSNLSSSQYDLDQSVEDSFAVYEQFWDQIEWTSNQIKNLSSGDFFEGNSNIALALDDGGLFVRDKILCESSGTFDQLFYNDINGQTTEIKSHLYPKYQSCSTASFNMDEESYIVGVKTSDISSPITINLPSGSQKIAGKEVIIKDEQFTAGSNNIEITCSDGLIDGQSNVIINQNSGHCSLYTNGNDWFVYGQS